MGKKSLLFLILVLETAISITIFINLEVFNFKELNISTFWLSRAWNLLYWNVGGYGIYTYQQNLCPISITYDCGRGSSDEVIRHDRGNRQLPGTKRFPPRNKYQTP